VLVAGAIKALFGYRPARRQRVVVLVSGVFCACAHAVLSKLEPY
jgi:hypothetical protein